MSVWSQKTSVGIYGGTVFNTLHASYNGEKENSDMQPGQEVGVLVDIPLGSHFSIQPGIGYILKGGKEKNDYGEDKIFLHQLEIPLNFVAKIPAGSGQFMLGAGPSLGLILAGKAKSKYSGETITEKLKIGNSADEDNLKRLDFVVNALIGYEFKAPFFIAIRYNLGLSNRLPKTDGDDSKLTSNYFGVRFGYFFGRKK